MDQNGAITAAEARPPGLGGVRAVLLAFLVALGMKSFLFDFMIAEGRSMLPAIEPGTLLLVNRAAYGLRVPGTGVCLFRWAAPKPGDVVVFYTPQGALAVKRCAGFSGPGLFTALGDNSLESYDSRSYGPIAAERIIGKVLGVK
jgi:signal peptidase I